MHTEGIRSAPGFSRWADLRVIVVHPLWDRNSPQGILADACASASAAAQSVRFIDTFNLLRRTSRSYQIIGERPV